MRPPMTDDEITLLKADLDKLGESQLVGIEAYEALHLLEIRRMTAKLEHIKRLLGSEENEVSRRADSLKFCEKGSSFETTRYYRAVFPC